MTNTLRSGVPPIYHCKKNLEEEAGVHQGYTAMADLSRPFLESVMKTMELKYI